MKNAWTCVCLFLVFVMLGLQSCESDEVRISNEALAFVNEVLELMEHESIKKNDIDWGDFRAKVLLKVGNAQTIEETLEGIELAIFMLEDKHSFLTTPNGKVIRPSFGLDCRVEAFGQPTLPDEIAYVKVDGFSGTFEQALSFASDIQDQVRAGDKNGLVGWIVDLRGDAGGNMWPMLLGLGPVLGEGVSGYFVDADGNQSSWGYLDGKAVAGTTTVMDLEDFYTLLQPNPKVAVLLAKGTASSGEAIAVSFSGRMDTRSFGTPTCSLSTGNRNFPLTEGYVLTLATTVLADRNMKLFGSSLSPDETVAGEGAVTAAIEWLKE